MEIQLKALDLRRERKNKESEDIFWAVTNGSAKHSLKSAV